MELSLLSLLGTPSADITSAKPVNVPDIGTVQPTAAQAFATILQLAESRLRIEGQERVMLGQTQKTQDTLDETLGLKPFGKANENALIAGIMPLSTLEEQSFVPQESIFAVVVFNPSFSAESLLSEGMTDETMPNVIDMDMPSTDLEFDAIEASTVSAEGIAVTGAQAVLPKPKVSEDFTEATAQDLEIIESAESVALTDADDVPAIPVEGPVQLQSDILYQPATYASVSPSIQPVLQQTQPVIATPERTIGEYIPQSPNTELNNIAPNVLQSEVPSAGQSPAPPLTQSLANQPQTQLTPESAQTSASITSGDDGLVEISDFSSELSDALDAPDLRLQELYSDSLQKKEALEQPLRFMRPAQAMLASPHEQIAVRISQAMADGEKNIQIRLHPEELGKVQIRLTIDADNNSVMRVIAESRETYDMLRADRATLERLLQESGLNTKQNNMFFSHSGNGSNGGNGGFGSQNNTPNGTGAQAELSQDIQAELTDANTLNNLSLIATSGLNIKV